MTYLELILSIEAAEKKNGIAKLDSISKEILKIIAAGEMSSRKVRMSDLSSVATFPTIKAHLKVLLDGGWIERADDESDKRIALLLITSRTRLVFEEITEALHAGPGLTRRSHGESFSSSTELQAFSELESKFNEFKENFLKSQVLE